MTLITSQPGIMEIALYEGGKSALAGVRDVLKLSSNENPLGPPASAIAALSDAAATMHRYPSTDHGPLRVAIAEIHGLEADQIICGVGSDEVLQFVTQAFSGPGDEIIHTAHGFSMYPILTHMAGAKPVRVSERDRVVDVEAIVAAISARTRIILIANPGNPTGTLLPMEDLTWLVEHVPGHVIIVLDGAYVEFADGYDGGASLVRDNPNLVMTRTFSKIYGLGGLRVGWGYAPKELIDVMTRIRQPFNLAIPQLAAAEAAVRDQAWVNRCADINREQRARLVGGLRQLGISCDDSAANFVLARFTDESEAEAADQALQSDGIIVRRVAGYGFPEGLRITVGDEAQTGRVLEALRRWRQT